MKVLLKIDIQGDFCAGGSLAVPDGDAVVPIANRLSREGDYDRRIASKDWHPANHKSFASQHPGKKPFIDSIVLHGLPQTLWTDHCIENSRGSEFHHELDTSDLDYTVYKGTDPEIDSYSAFFDNGKRRETTLRTYLLGELESRGETLEDLELHIVGLATDYCVAATARDARSLGIKTVVVVDGCRAVNLAPDDEVETLRSLAEIGVILRDSKEILEEVAREPSRPIERGLPA